MFVGLVLPGQRALSPRALAGGPIFICDLADFLTGCDVPCLEGGKRQDKTRALVLAQNVFEILSRTALSISCLGVWRLSLVAYSNILWALSNASTSLADHEEHIRKAYYIAVVVTWSMILYLMVDLHRTSDHAEKRMRIP